MDYKVVNAFDLSLIKTFHYLSFLFLESIDKFYWRFALVWSFFEGGFCKDDLHEISAIGS